MPRREACTAGASRLPGVTLLIAGLAIAATFVPSLPGLLEFSRAAVAGGEPWRWWTGHLVHVSAGHLFWDLTVFLALGWWCERERRGRFLACLILAAPAIPLGILLAHPGVASYQGLSGLDSALFLMLVATVLGRALRERAPGTAIVAVVLGLAFAVKVALEFATSATFFVTASAPTAVPVPLAHAIGGLVGWAVGGGGAASGGVRGAHRRPTTPCSAPVRDAPRGRGAALSMTTACR